MCAEHLASSQATARERGCCYPIRPAMARHAIWRATRAYHDRAASLLPQGPEDSLRVSMKDLLTDTQLCVVRPCCVRLQSAARAEASAANLQTTTSEHVPGLARKRWREFLGCPAPQWRWQSRSSSEQQQSPRRRSMSLRHICPVNPLHRALLCGFLGLVSELRRQTCLLEKLLVLARYATTDCPGPAIWSCKMAASSRPTVHLYT